MQFCGMNGILNKNYKNWMVEQSASISKAADEYGKKHCGRGVIHLPTWRIRKEEMAHDQQLSKLKVALSVIWSCLEAASSYRARYCEKSGYPQLRKAIKPVVNICIFTLNIGLRLYEYTFTDLVSIPHTSMPEWS
jgi:hypothetical protein